MRIRKTMACYCGLNDEYTPDGYYVDATGTYDLSNSSVPKKQISKTPVWIASVRQHVRTLKSEATLAFVAPNRDINYLEVPSDTFLSFERMRSRVLERTTIEVEGWTLNSFLRYLRMAELLCPNQILIGLEEFSISETTEVQNVR